MTPQVRLLKKVYFLLAFHCTACDTVYMSIYTTGEVATILDLSVNTVRQYCKRYRIGHKHGRDWAIASSDIDAIRSRMRDDPTWTEGEGEV